MGTVERMLRNPGVKTIAKLEAAVADVERRLAARQAEHARAAARLAEAQAERRVLLVDTDVIDPKQRGRADSAVRNATDDVAALADAIQELERRKDEAHGHLAAVRGQAIRDAAASERETAAAAVERGAVDLDRAIEALATAFEAVADAVPPGAISVKSHVPYWGRSEDSLSAYDVARAVVAEGLYRRCPEIFHVVEHGGEYRTINLPLSHRLPDGALDRHVPVQGATFSHSSAAAQALLVDPLRRSADAIRRGELSPDLPVAPVAESWPEVHVPSTSLVLARAISWAGVNGVPQHASAGGCELPEPIAEAALAAGLAYPADSDDGRSILRLLAEMPAAVLIRGPVGGRWTRDPQGVEAPHDLGGALIAWIDVERARLTARAAA